MEDSADDLRPCGNDFNGAFIDDAAVLRSHSPPLELLQFLPNRVDISKVQRKHCLADNARAKEFFGRDTWSAPGLVGCFFWCWWFLWVLCVVVGVLGAFAMFFLEI